MNNCVSNLRNNKASGRVSICGEHIKYAGAHLMVHLCLLFNAMLVTHLYPQSFFLA